MKKLFLTGIAVAALLAASSLTLRADEPIALKLSAIMENPDNPFITSSSFEDKTVKVKITTKDILELLEDAYELTPGTLTDGELWIYDDGDEFFFALDSNGDFVLDTGGSTPGGFYFYGSDDDDIFAEKETDNTFSETLTFIKTVYYNDPNADLVYFQIFGKAVEKDSDNSNNGKFKESISFQGHGDYFVDEVVTAVMSGGFSGHESGID